MTYLGTLTKKHVGSSQVTIDGRTWYLARPVTIADVGRYIRRRQTDEGTIIEIENDEQYTKRTKAAHRRQRMGDAQ